jgi:hypothetical protein
MTVTIPIISTFNAKGINKATKAFDKLGHSVTRSLSVIAVEEFARRSIRAFAANEKSVALLTNTLKNLGQEYMATGVNKFIDDLTLATGVTKEQLIPAFQGLFIATGSVAKAQESLKLAMDVSAGTGRDLESVQRALSKAYLGNTTSLTRLGAGLSKTLLKSGDMVKITEQLAKTFKGDASVAADTFTGKMNRLKASVTEAQVVIGASMVDALQKLGGGAGIDGTQKAFKSLGDEIANIILGIGDMITAIKPLLPLLGAVALAMVTIANPFVGAAIGIALVAGQAHKSAVANYYAPSRSTISYGGRAGSMSGMTGGGGVPSGVKAAGSGLGMSVTGASDYYSNKSKRVNALLAKQKKDELNALTAKNQATAEELKLKKDQAALDELKKKFDLERIGILAALAQATDNETKARLLAMLAILDGSAAGVKTASENLAKVMADKALAEAAATESLLKFSGAATIGASSSAALSVAYAKSIGDVNAALIAAASVHPSALAANESGVIGAASIAAQIAAAQAIFTAGLTASSASGATRDKQIDALLAALATATAAANANPVPVIKVVTDPTVIVSVVQDAVVENSRSGNSFYQAGSLLAI